jgi:virginiamycin B lyase
VRVDPTTKQVKVWPLPSESMPDANLNTAAFDGKGRIWFTGQNGIYDRLDPKSGDMKVWDAPMGRGPYGITGTPRDDIWFVSLAGNYLANVDLETGAPTVYEPPTKGQDARRVWSDSKGRLWVSEWNSGNVSVYDPVAKSWKQWKLPGEKPRTYAVWVDPDDKVWLSDWAANAIVRFDPETQKFESLSQRSPELQCAPDASPQGRDVDCRVRHGTHSCDSLPHEDQLTRRLTRVTAVCVRALAGALLARV